MERVTSESNNELAACSGLQGKETRPSKIKLSFPNQLLLFQTAVQISSQQADHHHKTASGQNKSLYFFISGKSPEILLAKAK